MRNMNKLVVTAGAVSAVALGATACGGSNGSNEAVPTNAGATTAAGNSYCDVTPYTVGNFQTKVGANIMQSNEEIKPGGDLSKAADQAAKALAPNSLALATVDTIYSAGNNAINPVEVAQESAGESSRMNADSKYYTDICNKVIGRIVTTHTLRSYQSPTGLVTTYAPTYTQNVLTSLDALSTPNTSPVEVLTITPIKNDPKETINNQIAQTWGMTAEGRIIQTADTEGDSRADVTGKPVNATPNASGAPLAPSPSPSIQPTPEQANQSDQNGSIGQTPKGGIASGPSSESLNNGSQDEDTKGKDKTPVKGGGSSTPVTSPATGTVSTPKPAPTPGPTPAGTPYVPPTATSGGGGSKSTPEPLPTECNPAMPDPSC